MAFPLYKYYDYLNAKINKYQRLYGDNYKKVALKLVYWNLKFCCRLPLSLQNFSDNMQHILIIMSGGLGDFCFTAKYIEALHRYLGNNTIFDIQVPKEDFYFLEYILKEKTYIQHILIDLPQKQYDAEIYIVRFPVVLSYIKKRLDEKTIQYVYKLEKFYRENPLIVSNDYIGRCWSLLKGQRRENQADVDNILNMSQSEFKINLPNNEDIVLSKYGLDKQKFITIQTGAGVHFQHIKNETRQWPIEYYYELVNILKNEYPQYKIVQLGVEYQSLCSNIDLDLRGKTAVPELFVLLKNAKLHISQEGGMPIIRHFVKGGKSIVLFGPTDENFFGFSENINISARPCNNCCEWVTNDWMNRCIKTGSSADCMNNLTAETVMNEIKKCKGLD